MKILIVKYYLTEVVDIHRTNCMLEFLMLSTRKEKSVYIADAGRGAKETKTIYFQGV